MPKRIPIAGFTIRATRTAALTRFLRLKLRLRQHVTVLFANANFVLQCKALSNEIAKTSDLIIVNDGVAMDMAAHLCTGGGFPENLNGTDFTPALLIDLDAGSPVFLFGARPDVVQQAGDAVHRLYGAEVCGTQDGYSVWNDEDALNQRINAARPDVLLVGLGNPLQEEWILRNRPALEVPLILGVGAFFDFVSGNIPRAPRIVRKLRLEWAYRLGLEPRRLIYRYTVGMYKFFKLALSEKRAP